MRRLISCVYPVFPVTQEDSNTPAYVPYTFPCERIDPGEDGARYTVPKQVTIETTDDSQTTTQRHLLVNDHPVNDGANATKGFGKNYCTNIWNVDLTSYNATS